MADRSQAVATDAAGRFRLEGLPPGKTEFEATAAGYVPQHVTKELNGPGDTNVEVPLKGAGVVAGLVVNAVSKVPVSGAKIVLAGQSQGVETDAAGRFRLEGLSPGKAEFDAAAAGYAAQHFAQELKDAGETSVEVLLKGAGVLAGVVVDAASKAPVSGAKIVLAGQSQGVGDRCCRPVPPGRAVARQGGVRCHRDGLRPPARHTGTEGRGRVEH